MFQYIQEYTGIVSPGILAVFMMGLFYKKATNQSAIWAVLLSIPIALSLKLIPDFPFMHQMGITCLLSMLIIVAVSYIEAKGSDDSKAIVLSSKLFKTGKVFNISAYAICIILVVLYAMFW